MPTLKLDNGLPVLMDLMDSVESVSVGVFVGSGACSETVANNGVAHYLEHMAFKGTVRRSAEDISREVEEVGGQMNAFTGREMTAYVIKVLREDLPLAMDILGDILLNSTFDKEEMERERGVILQEMGMYEDQPDSKVFENLEEVMYPDQPMGRKIIGTAETVQSLMPEDLRAFMDENYAIRNMAVSAAGSFDPHELVGLCKEHLGGLRDFKVKPPEAPVYQSGAAREQRDLEQAHVSMAWEGVCVSDPRMWAAKIWGMVMGGGMSSRLFQEIREKRGLVYSVWSGHFAQTRSGVVYVNAGTDPEKVEELIEVVDAEMAKTNITEAEVSKVKTQLSAGIRMAQEQTMHRMTSAAQDWFQFGCVEPLNETLEHIEAVTLNEVLAIQEALLLPEKRSLSILSSTA